ncbi:MAG: hypothetical protein AUK48_06680 [Oscillatoriales cyanobacterium CG2_30_44_21]|nr:MAG: hypothetical protein AUK48_06680 [Oscillatoriales cyanobacterium CG2_30_44_21]
MNWRKIHRFIAPILVLPLLLTTITGVIYRVGRSWFGMSKDLGKVLLDIHQGSFLGSDLRTFYVFLDGLGLIGLIVTGIVMSGIFGKKRRRSVE